MNNKTCSFSIFKWFLNYPNLALELEVNKNCLEHLKYQQVMILLTVAFTSGSEILKKVYYCTLLKHKLYLYFCIFNMSNIYTYILLIAKHT